MKTSTLRNFATSFTTMIFLVIGISGVMMFFHFNDKHVKLLHEVIGLAFVVFAVFHVIMNWKSMKNYFSKKVFLSAVLVVSVISGAFIINSSLKTTANPKVLAIKGVLNAPVENSFAVLGVDYEIAISKLKEKNFKKVDSQTIASIAKANNTSPFEIISIITKK